MIKYIGIPYSFRDFNCWDFVVKARQDNGMSTKHFKPRNLGSAFDVIEAEMQKLDSGLMLVESPQNFDIVMCEDRTLKKNRYHCGLYFNGLVFHCEKTRGQVVCDYFNAFKGMFGRVTFWR